MFEQLLDYSHKRVILNEDQSLFFQNQFKIIHAQKDEILLPKGSICKHLYFVNKGVVKTFYSNEKGLIAINGLAIENNFCTSLSSFIYQIPSLETIQTMEESEILAISHTDFYTMIQREPIFEKLYLKIIEEYHHYLSWRMESLMNLESIEKYKILKKNYPSLFRRLSQKTIAAYLGISPKTYQRVLKEL